MLLIGFRKQETFAETLIAAYMKGNFTPLAVGDLGLPADTHFAPFDVSQELIVFGCSIRFNIAPARRI